MEKTSKSDQPKIIGQKCLEQFKFVSKFKNLVKIVAFKCWGFLFVWISAAQLTDNWLNFCGIAELSWPTNHSLQT